MATQTQLNLTAMNAALKELYASQVVENMVYSDRPFLAMVPKMTEFGGKYMPIPIVHGVSQGRSATFSSALANQTGNLVESFLLTRKKDYSIATIDNETMLSSQTDKMTFIQGAKFVVDGAIQSISNSIASALFRSGTGSVGQISGSVTSGVVNLVNPADIVNIEVGMTLNAAQTDGGTLEAGVGYVLSVNRAIGQFTVSASSITGSAGTPSGWGDGDFIVVNGDINAKLNGLAGWVPASAPSATPFFGVDRSVDTTRLGGLRYNGAAQSIEEALIDASSLLAREGGRPDYAFVNYASYAALEKALGSKVQYVDLKANAEVGFRGIVVNGAASMIKVIPDWAQQSKVCHLLTMKTWKLCSAGPAPQILRYGDGLEMLRVTNQDASEVRVGMYGNLACNAPGWNCHVTLGA